VRVGSLERLAVEAGGDDAGEVGALEDVFVRAAQCVIDGLAGGLGFGDLVIELGELVPSEPLPVVERDGVGTIGTRPVAVVGLAMVAIGNGLLIGLSADGNIYAEALPGVVVFALGGGPLFVAAITSALGRVGLHQSGLVSGIVYTFNQLGAAICVAVASTVAAAGLTSNPSIDGFTDAFTVFTVVPAAAALLSLRLVPSGSHR
jgi:hypothetical protein